MYSNNRKQNVLIVETKLNSMENIDIWEIIIRNK